MRPGSNFLKELHNSSCPENLTIYCCYSQKDKVATGKRGVFESPTVSHRVVSVPMHHIAHFEFLYRRDVGDYLARLLRGPQKTVKGRNPDDKEAKEAQ